jgi:hypothetical protein
VIAAAQVAQPAPVTAEAPERHGALGALKLVAGIVAAPFIGLAYIVVLPFAGLAAVAWMGLKAAFVRAA